jgi:hypothetical protein
MATLPTLEQEENLGLTGELKMPVKAKGLLSKLPPGLDSLMFRTNILDLGKLLPKTKRFIFLKIRFIEIFRDRSEILGLKNNSPQQGGGNKRGGQDAAASVTFNITLGLRWRASFNHIK